MWMGRRFSMNMVLFLIFVTLLSSRSVSGVLVSGSDVQYVEQYKTATINYRFDDAVKVFSVIWEYKVSASDTWRRIYSVNGNGFPNIDDPAQLVLKFLDRVQFKGDVPRGNLRLDIVDFTVRDNGLFRCHVVNSKPDLYNTTTLKSIVVSNVTQLTVNTDDIKQGESATLSCTVTRGVPAPRIHILKGATVINESVGSETQQTTFTHLFTSVSRRDDGSYSCRSTTLGRRGRMVPSVNIKVKFPPIIVNTEEQLYGCKGHPVTMDCNVIGYPKPVLKRFDPNGKEIDKETFELKEFGMYRCEASNALGTTALNITISGMTGKPDKPSFGSCSFEGLSWNYLSHEVLYTLQVMENNEWKDLVPKSPDVNYNPSAQDKFDSKQDYKFRIIASNCIGNTTSDECVIEGTGAPVASKGSGTNAGAIAGAVVGVLIVVVVAALLYIFIVKKRGREPKSGSLVKKDKTTEVNPEPKPPRSKNPNDLLYGDESPDVNNPRDQTPSPRQTGYAEIEDDEPADIKHANVPSWV